MGETSAVVDKSSGKLVTVPSSIRRVSLEYCTNLLTNRSPKVEYEDDLTIKHLIHDVRMNEEVESDLYQLSFQQFNFSLETLSKKPGSKYEFIVNSGPSFTSALFKIYQVVWQTECIPDSWKKTDLVQVYKGTGEMSNLNNYRHLHIKQDIPKLFGHMVMTVAKDIIGRNMSKFQIGAMAGHRPQEHLFTLKSIIALYDTLKTPLFLTMWDIIKFFFYRESLRDVMNEIYKLGIKGKIYYMR